MDEWTNGRIAAMPNLPNESLSHNSTFWVEKLLSILHFFLTKEHEHGETAGPSLHP